MGVVCQYFLKIEELGLGSHSGCPQNSHAVAERSRPSLQPQVPALSVYQAEVFLQSINQN